MSLTPRLVAIQGIGFTPIQLAVQGLLEQLASDNNGWPAETVQGVAGKNRPDEVNMKGYVDRLNREREVYNLTRLQQDDQDASEFILSLFQMEFF
jgi:hypothetical protein